MIFAIATADFKERTRRFSFLVMCGLALFAAFWFVPNTNAGFSTLIVDSETFRQASNPTWIPLAAAMCTGMFLPLLGFAYLKGAIEIDRSTGILSLLQTSGTSRFCIVLGKFLSNCILLFAITGIVAVGSVAMILLRFPGQWLSFWSLISPFLAIFPGLIFTAAVAVLFETIPYLRTKQGAIWGVLLFFVLFVIIVSATTMSENFLLAVLDFSSYSWFRDSAVVAAGGRDVHITVLGGGSLLKHTGTEELIFAGVPMTAIRLVQKGFLICFSAVIVCIASLLLEKRPLHSRARKLSKMRIATLQRRENTHNAASPSVKENPTWQPVPIGNFSIFRQTTLELHRISVEVPKLLMLAMLGMFIACIFAPFETSLTILLPITYALAMLPLSGLGTTEKSCGMDTLFGTVDGGVRRQLLASTLAGIALSIVLCAPLLLRSVIIGKWLSFLALFLFAVCVPIVAEVIGRLARTPRAFQILFIILLYWMLNAPGFLLPW